MTELACSQTKCLFEIVQNGSVRLEVQPSAANARGALVVPVGKNGSGDALGGSGDARSVGVAVNDDVRLVREGRLVERALVDVGDVGRFGGLARAAARPGVFGHLQALSERKAKHEPLPPDAWPAPAAPG